MANAVESNRISFTKRIDESEYHGYQHWLFRDGKAITCFVPDGEDVDLARLADTLRRELDESN